MFTVCWTSVDGAGRFAQQWLTFKDAAAEADRCQRNSDAYGNVFAYRYQVRDATGNLQVPHDEPRGEITVEKHVVSMKNAAQIKKWFETRGGIAVWSSINLSNPGAGWTTPLHSESGVRAMKPSWQASDTPRVITDPDEVLVAVDKEVKRFRVADLSEQQRAVVQADRPRL